MRSAVMALWLAVGCASAPPPRSRADVDGALARWIEGEASAPSTIAIRRERALGAPVRIAHRERARIPEGRVIDVRFEGAPLASALAMLADAADVNLVIGEGVDGTVSTDLRRVRPLAAMQALAEAHGVSLAIRGRMVVARRSGL